MRYLNNIRQLFIGRRLLHCFFSCLATVLTLNSALADPVDIADIPPSLSAGVEPNIMFIIDDSGSMQFELPESPYTSSTDYLFPPVSDMYGQNIYEDNIFDFSDNNPRNRYFRSNHNNPFFYNPEKTYEPWYKGDRSQWPDSNPTAASYFPGLTNSATLNLTARQSNYRWVEYEGNGNYDHEGDWKYYWPITYYVLKNDGDDVWEKDSYYRYQIRDENAYRKDLATGDEELVSTLQFGNGPERNVEDEIQNFANWFSYYRSRTLAARSGIGNAFSQQPEGMRVGYGRLNKGSSTVDGVSTSTIVNGVRSFKGNDREQFFTSLYTDKTPNKGTPLRLALKRAGEYFERRDNQGPWGAEPGNNNSSAHLECRQSFTILMTDGYWSGGSPGVGDVDSEDGDPIDDYEGYKATAPFKDGHSDTLADVAMHYWNRDLRPDLGNKVPTSGVNPAFWQHMVTFGVGLGVSGTIDYPDSDPFAEIGKDNPSFTWPNPVGNEPAKVDDLLHAAVNSRGGFFSVDDPDSFATELSNVLSVIISRVEQSSTAAAASSAVFSEGTLSYSAGYRSTDWSGALQASRILSGGGRGQLMWDAERELESKGFSARELFTSSGLGGVALSFGSLSDDQKEALNTGLDGTSDGLGAERIAWLTGDNSAGDDFRERTYKAEGSAVTRPRMLGDIIGSNPQYAGKENFGHRRLGGTEGADYATFRASEAYNERPDAIYVGANDGFLHAFHAKTGEELFAYMPSEFLNPAPGKSYAPVNELMDPEYDHRFFVDGTPTISDAYIDNQWRTVLLGTTGVGGRTVFALDVTDPESFSANDVLWEFTAPELGRGVSDAQIVRLESGWAAVFGNGYNSASHEAALFVVDLGTGNLVSKVETAEGDANEPNGLAAPAIMVDPRSGVALRAYAGDLQGNVWRFDFGSSKAELLFEASDETGTPQPITAAPRLAYVPGGTASEVVVLFGTGAYFRVGDKTDTQVQSLYGIYDDGKASSIDRDDLLKQQLTSHGTVEYSVDTGATSEVQEFEVRSVSNHALSRSDKGWVLDLDTAVGERVISPADFPSGYPVKRVRFSTLIPEDNACGSGQTGCVLDIDLKTGGKTANHVFDLNRDGKYDLGDAANSDIVNGVCNVTSGERLTVVSENGNDRLLDSEIQDVGDDYDGPIVDPDPDPGDPDDPDDPDDPQPGPPCTGPLCIEGNDMGFGRQNWEELR